MSRGETEELLVLMVDGAASRALLGEARPVLVSEIAGGLGESGKILRKLVAAGATWT